MVVDKWSRNEGRVYVHKIDKLPSHHELRFAQRVAGSDPAHESIRALTVPNAGGASAVSEAYSIELMLRIMRDAKLMAPRVLLELDELLVGVSVTRAQCSPHLVRGRASPDQEDIEPRVRQLRRRRRAMPPSAARVGPVPGGGRHPPARVEVPRPQVARRARRRLGARRLDQCLFRLLYLFQPDVVVQFTRRISPRTFRSFRSAPSTR